MGFIENAKAVVARYGDNHVTRNCVLDVLSLDSTGISVTEANKTALKDVIIGIGDQLIDGTSVNALIDKAVELFPSAETELENARKVFRDKTDTTRETDCTDLVMSIANAMLDELTPFDTTE